MSDQSPGGVLYTDYARLKTGTPLLALWSYISHMREADRAAVSVNAAGDREFWLDRTDPLLNSILPGTAVSIVVNSGSEWVSGRSLTSTQMLPRAFVIGPFTRPRLLRVGHEVRAIGIVMPSHVAAPLCGLSATKLVDRIVALDDIWPAARVRELTTQLTDKDFGTALQVLSANVLAGASLEGEAQDIARSVIDDIRRRGGQVSVDRVAAAHGISRQLLTRKFRDATGLPPKLFARITRFQALVRALLVHDVSEWAGVASEMGFFDQAHMINEFRRFAGQSPIQFFRPHGGPIDADRVKIKGRPSQWLK